MAKRFEPVTKGKCPIWCFKRSKRVGKIWRHPYIPRLARAVAKFFAERPAEMCGRSESDRGGDLHNLLAIGRIT